MPKKIETNQEQKEAVEFNGNRLLIIAGAGTGKTTVIIERIAHLIENNKVGESGVLALTFTEKAAGEMEDRLAKKLKNGGYDCNITTFHSFGQKILENYGFHIGLPTHFRILDESSAWMLLRKNLDALKLKKFRPIGNPSGFLYTLLKHFARCKEALISSQDYLAFAEDCKLNNDREFTGDLDQQTMEEIAFAYHAYNKLLLDNNCIDLSDLIYYSYKLLNLDPKIAKIFSNKYKYIFIDEFQDTNWSQYELIKKIVGESTFLTVVGDDDQSIYKFRGASLSNILHFKEDYKDSHEILLTKNYRSKQNILDSAYLLIQNNNPNRLETKLGKSKKLIAEKSGVGEIKACVFHDDVEEAEEIAKKLRIFKDENPEMFWNENAILVRSNKQAETILRVLENFGIPSQFLSATGLYKEHAVIDILAYLNVLVGNHESRAFYRLLTMPHFQISPDTINAIIYFAKKDCISLYKTALKYSSLQIQESDKDKLKKLMQLLSSGAEIVHKSTVSRVVYQFLENSGYLNWLASFENTPDIHASWIPIVSDFYKHIKTFDSENEGVKTIDFIEYHNFLVEAGFEGPKTILRTENDAVEIMTIHKAKGLEFKNVFVTNLSEGRFPAKNRSEQIEIPNELLKDIILEGDSHMEEERRLFYVAITRAKEKLFLSYSAYPGKSSVREARPSRFVLESNITISNSILNNTSLPKENYKENIDLALQYKISEKFSFSQLKSFETCPLQYKFQHILNVPHSERPQLIFGTTIHESLYRFYQILIEKNFKEQAYLFSDIKNEQKIAAPKEDELILIYNTLWKGEWFENEEEKNNYYEIGKKIIKSFYKKTQEDGWTVPVAIETAFNFTYNGNIFHGRIDRIDRMTNGLLEIVDYKTGKPKEKLTAEDKKQLLIYALAFKYDPNLSKFGNIGKLSFYYLDDLSKQSFEPDGKLIGDLLEEIDLTVGEIKKGNFKAKPSQFVCKYCDYKNICPFREL